MEVDGRNQDDRFRPKIGDLVRFRGEVYDGYVELWHDSSPEEDVLMPMRFVSCQAYALVIDRAIASCKVFTETHIGWVDDCDLETIS